MKIVLPAHNEYRNGEHRVTTAADKRIDRQNAIDGAIILTVVVAAPLIALYSIFA